MKFGLRNIRALMKYAGHPEKRFPSIHVAGTNGKGSTASYLASIAMEAGYRTGLYTSPHLLRFTERIRINGTELSEERLVYYVKALRPAIEASRATFFEATTAVAFLYFADERVELAVIETGMGGRFDATNIVVPLVSVITNVALDHTEHLGSTLPKIAREKGGIIKERVPVVTGAKDPSVLEVFRQIARKKQTRVYRTEDVARGVPTPGIQGRHGVRLTTGFMRGKKVVPGLPGEHQATNARLAIAAYDLIMRTSDVWFRGITRVAVVRGLERVRRNTGIRGRLERVRWKGTFILDVAHNPDGTRTLMKSLPRGKAEAGGGRFWSDEGQGLHGNAGVTLGSRFFHCCSRAEDRTRIAGPGVDPGGRENRREGPAWAERLSGDWAWPGVLQAVPERSW